MQPQIAKEHLQTYSSLNLVADEHQFTTIAKLRQSLIEDKDPTILGGKL